MNMMLRKTHLRGSASNSFSGGGTFWDNIGFGVGSGSGSGQESDSGTDTAGTEYRLRPVDLPILDLFFVLRVPEEVIGHRRENISPTSETPGTTRLLECDK